MRKIKIITSQFGATTKYFQLFLDTCGFNPFVEWILYTDFPQGRYVYPKNMEVRQVTQEKLRERLQRCFDFEVRFTSAKDFAAFRPLYGYIFAEDLIGYDYWGTCDCDVLFGDLHSVLNACDGLTDKVLPKGHLFLVRNDKTLNGFLRTHPLMLQAIDKSKPPLPVVEEEAFPRVLKEEYGASFNNEMPFAQAHPRLGHFKLIDTYAANKALGLSLDSLCGVPYVATLRSGRLQGWFILPNHSIQVLDLSYIHFFKRDVAAMCSRLNSTGNFLIIPNRILPYDGHDLSYAEVCWLNHPRIHWRYFFDRMNWPTVRRKIIKLFK
jgi:hypothetical protein